MCRKYGSTYREAIEMHHASERERIDELKISDDLGLASSGATLAMAAASLTQGVGMRDHTRDN